VAWTKSERYCLFASIYGSLFWAEINMDYPLDWSIIQGNNLYNEDAPSNDWLDFRFDIFSENKEVYIADIKNYLTDWSKTFNIVKAILITFLIELDEATVETNELDVNFIGKYIGENTPLVHAIISKMIAQKGIILPVEENEVEK
jgi:hypothetical protein